MPLSSHNMFFISKCLFLNCFLSSTSITRRSLYHVITGGGNPVALQGNVTFCFSLTVMEGGGFITKFGDSVNMIKQMVLVMTLSRLRCKFWEINENVFDYSPLLSYPFYSVRGGRGKSLLCYSPTLFSSSGSPGSHHSKR